MQKQKTNKEGYYLPSQDSRYYYPSPYNHIIQSNDLVRTTNNLSLNAKRLFLVALSSIRNLEDSEFIKTKLLVSDLKNLFNNTSNKFNQQMNDASRELLKTSVYIYNEENNCCTEYNIMKSCSYFLDYNSVSAIAFSFNEELKPYLLELKNNYIDIPIQLILGLPTSTSIDLILFLLKRFNICYNNASKEDKDTFSKTITVSTLELMQLFTPDAFYQYQYKAQNRWDKVNFKYESFKRMNTLAIKPSVDYINQNGYFQVKVKYLRNDVENPRSISHVEFNITIGQNLLEFNKNKVEHSRKVKEHKELERVAEYYKKRFGTYEGHLINFVKEHNYNVYVMKLSAILLQSYLEMNSLGRYVEDAWKENGLVGIRCKDPLKFLSQSFEKMSFIYDINNRDEMSTDKYYLREYAGDMTLAEELGNKLLRAEIDKLFDKALQSTYDNPNEDYYYDREEPDE